MAVFKLRAFLFTCLAVVVCCHPTMAVESLLRVKQQAVDATFLSATTQGDLLFEEEGKAFHVRLDELVRWSSQRTNTERSELLLTDGSRLVLAEAWTGQPSWQMTDDSVLATTSVFGKVELQRKQVRAILIHAPNDLNQRRQLFNQRQDGKSDVLRLTNGDQWQGQVIRLEKTQDGSRRIHLLLDSASEPLQLPENRVAAILFGRPNPQTNLQIRLEIGLHDGSLLMAASLVADAEQLRVRLAGGVELIGVDRRDVVSLRSLMASCVYLSDLVASDYQHVPYLEIPWPYQRDRNVLGGFLQAAGRNYAKGLGMHSAARLTYSLDIAKGFQRFVASIGVDDKAERRGSVVFRVYLQQDGAWQQAFASPVVRGGDLPLSISVELGDATQLSLVTDFADRGDELDYANWLDARLE